MEDYSDESGGSESEGQFYGYSHEDQEGSDEEEDDVEEPTHRSGRYHVHSGNDFSVFSFGYDEDDEHETSDQETSDVGNPLIDLEAEEFGDDSGDIDEEGSSDGEEGNSDEDDSFQRAVHGGYYSDGESVTPDYEFPQFTRLPPELRAHIWSFFCPELDKSMPRVLPFLMKCPNSQAQFADSLVSSAMVRVSDGVGLEGATARVRALCAVHRESRELGLRRFPDRLGFDHNPMNNKPTASLVFNKESDVVFLNPFVDYDSLEVGFFCKLPDFSAAIQNIAVEIHGAMELAESGPEPWSEICAFPNLRKFYVAKQCASGLNPEQLDVEECCRPRDAKWCGSPSIYRYQICNTGDKYNISRGQEMLFCWPDLEKNRLFAESEIRPAMVTTVVGRTYDEDPDLLRDETQLLLDALQRRVGADVEIWPLVSFVNENVFVHDELRRHCGEPDVEYPEEEEDYSDLVDDDESDTSLDGFIASDTEEGTVENDEDDSSGDEDDLVVDEGDPEREQAAVRSEELWEGFSNAEEDPIDLTTNGHNGPIDAGNFSSPEPESVNGNLADSDEENSDAPAVVASQPRKRRVIESDSEEDVDEDAPPEPKRPRTGARPTRVLDSDSDE